MAENKFLDKNGLKHFSKVLSNYPDNTILSAVINAISDMISETSESNKNYTDSKVMQSDWGQNDETSPDYVKNRPFYINGLNLEIALTEAQKQQFRESIKAAESDHIHSAYSITAGTFAGMIAAQSSGQAASEMCLRNSKLVSSEENLLSTSLFVYILSNLVA